MALKLVTPDADQMQDALDDRKIDLSRLSADVKRCIMQHGKSRVINAFLDTWRLADDEGAKW